MSAGLRHWPSFRPKRAAKNRGAGLPLRQRRKPLTTRKSPGAWLNRTKVLTDVRSLIQMREPCVASLRSDRHQIGLTDRHHWNAQHEASVLLLVEVTKLVWQAKGSR